MINSLVKLPGGVGDTTPTNSVDPNQLSLGIQIEMEHTNDPDIAKEISMDHLTEDPEYYTKLIKAGLAKEFKPSHNSGFGDPDQSFNDAARLGSDITVTPGNNVVGTVGNTSNGQVSGRNSEPIINKTIDIELEGKKKHKRKPKPTNPSLWSSAKAAARSKFDVYPSAYANAWAAKWYKKHGGGWRMSESNIMSYDNGNNKNPIVVMDSPFPAEVSPEGSGTYGSGYDFVGYPENVQKPMSKQKIKEYVKKLVTEMIEEEASMAASDLDSIIHHANELKQLNAITDEAELEDWIKAKLTLANQHLIAVFDNLNHKHGSTKTQDNDADDADDAQMEKCDAGCDCEKCSSVDEKCDADCDCEKCSSVDEKCDAGCDCEKCSSVDESKEKWIGKIGMKKGALHKQLHVPQDKKIPADKLAAAAKKGGKLGKRARLAQTLGKLKKK